MEIKVTLLNGEEIKNYSTFAQIGNFARIGTASTSEAEKIGKYCIDSSHGSPQRVPRFIFEIKGVSRTMSHQLVRHNVGVVHNQRSQRYCLEDGFNYYKPKEFEGKKYLVLVEQEDEDIFLELTFDDLMRISRELYIQAIGDGVPADEARELLSNAVETMINSDFTFQALAHFCNDRLCNRASRQIKEVARQMVSEVKKVDLEASKYLVPKCHPNALGYCPESKKDSCGLRPLKSEVIIK